jgi:hypothetical protein
MASQAPANLPLFYNSLSPLSSSAHATYKTRSAETAPFLASNHAVPITIDEFVAAGRHYPIVFSAGDNPVPLALMGLNEGINTFVDEEGKLLGETYVPAYIRRYPFMLAKTSPNAEELSLCFDPDSGWSASMRTAIRSSRTARLAKPPPRSSNSARNSSFRPSARPRSSRSCRIRRC